ncbi:MAG: HlyC/CorC family transporter [Acidimicrobiia bacterium]|nr:HlyC/CorC family transporter [Acidimicrobiia bacterium]
MGDLQLITALILLFLAAVFLAAAEAALLRVARVRVEVLADQGDAGAARVLSLIQDLPRIMNTVLLTVLFVQIGAATVVGVLAERNFGGFGVTIASVLLTIALFVYAEAIPKTYAVRRPFAVARWVARPVSWLAALLRPIVSILVWLADLQAPGQGIASSVGVSEEELRRLAAEAASSGEIEPTDAELMERVFELGDARVDEILVPRLHIVAVGADTPVSVALDVAIATGHRRLPVYENDLDSINGVVRLRQLAAAVAEGQDVTAGSIGTAPLVVPESKRVIELLRLMQRAGLHIAVVVDEHGGTAGIVTIEDVVSEVLGEVADEGEARKPEIEAVDGRLLVDAATDVDDLASRLDVEFPTGDFHTVGGLVINAAGRIPETGESIEIAGHQFLVLSASDRRVRKLEIT